MSALRHRNETQTEHAGFSEWIAIVLVSFGIRRCTALRNLEVSSRDFFRHALVLDTGPVREVMAMELFTIFTRLAFGATMILAVLCVLLETDWRCAVSVSRDS